MNHLINSYYKIVKYSQTIYKVKGYEIFTLKMKVYKKQVNLFNIDEAKKILQFSIHHINKNLKINNKLFVKETSLKLLKKVKKINEYYSNYKKQDEVELKNFCQEIKNNYQKVSDFDEQLIAYMIIISEKIYCQTPTLIQIICLLYY